MVCCSLLVFSLFVVCVCVVRSSLRVVRCSLFVVVCCSLCVARRLLLVGCGFVVWWFVVCWFVVCCLWFVRCFVIDVGCLWFVRCCVCVCLLLVVLRVACSLFVIGCCCWV